MKVEWKTNDEKLKTYQDYLLKLANEFKEIKFNHINRDKNQFANALATLALMTHINIGSRIQYWEQDPTNKHQNKKSPI